MKKFIITDPCYIMDEKQYDAICTDHCNFEGQQFPLSSKHKKTGEEIIFHIIERTENGDGGCTFNGQGICVDSGLLCIAEIVSEWNERWGATFDTLIEAERSFPLVEAEMNIEF